MPADDITKSGCLPRRVADQGTRLLKFLSRADPDRSDGACMEELDGHPFSIGWYYTPPKGVRVCVTLISAAPIVAIASICVLIALVQKLAVGGLALGGLEG